MVKGLNRFLFCKQKLCLLLVPPELYNLSICRSMIHLNIKLCKKNRKQQILSKNAFNTTLGEKTPRHGCVLGRDSMIMIMGDVINVLENV